MKNFRRVFILTLLIATITGIVIMPAFIQANIGVTQGTVKKPSYTHRESIPDRYKWDLTDIYPNKEEWEKDYKLVQKLSDKINNYEGKLGESAEMLSNALTLQTRINKHLEKLYVYAHLQLDLNNKNTSYQVLADRASQLASQVAQQSAYIIPEISNIEKEQLLAFLKHPKMKMYRNDMKELLEKKNKIRSKEVEEVLAGTLKISSTAQSVYTMLMQADFPYPTLETTKDGKKIQLTPSSFVDILQSENRTLRKRAFQTYYEKIDQFRNTLASLLQSEVRANNFYAQQHHYDSALEASLGSSNIPSDVYNQLIEVTHNHLPLLHRYVALKKKLLGLEEMHMYDLYTPIAKHHSEKYIPFEKAVNIVKTGLAPLGQNYTGIVEKGFTSNWVDVYSTPGKSSGAYNWGSYSTHPFILLNYQGTFNDVFTIAHEMGHAMHSYLSNQNQPYPKAQYEIFVAEVASTLNEALLMEKMLNEASSREEQIRLLHHSLEQFRGTFFRQVMFAEFEKIIHEKQAAGIVLTAQKLKDIYYQLNKKYYGPDIVVDKEIAMEWARVPHFYRNFYVYQYATGFAAANALSKEILKGQEGKSRYIEFLKAGGTKDPIDLLKDAGVDMTSTAPLNAAMDIFKERLKQLEQLTAK